MTDALFLLAWMTKRRIGAAERKRSDERNPERRRVRPNVSAAGAIGTAHQNHPFRTEDIKIRKKKGT